MSVIQNNILAGASGQGGGGFEIKNSLRFRGAQYLTRVNTGTNNTNDRYTISFWVKRGTIGTGVIQACVSGIDNSAQNSLWEYTGFWSNDTVYSYSVSWGAAGGNGLYRDPSAWYHIVTYGSGVQARTYVNNVQIGVDISGSKLSWITQTNGTSYIGCANENDGSPLEMFFDGYLAEIRVLDGSGATPGVFGEYNDDGIWVPKDPADVNVNYGNNGFYLDFSDPADIGADRSGNGNDFTATGFQLSSATSETYDLMEDTPTSNYATYNPIWFFETNQSGPAYRKGNLNYYSDYWGTWSQDAATISLKGGKYYWEVRCINNYSNQFHAGIVRGQSSGTSSLRQLGYDPDGKLFAYAYNANTYSDTSGKIIGSNDGEGTTTSNAIATSLTRISNGRIIGIAADMVNGTLDFYNQGVFIYQASPNPDYDWFPATTGYYLGESSINFGQQPFTYTPPAGYKALNAASMPAATITNPSDHFEVITDSGSNILTAAQAKFSNGLWWIKDRNNSNQHQFVDSVRGGNLALTCPSIANETSYSAPSGNSVAWCWAVPSTASTNSQGDITVQLAANPTAGFSIATYTGNGGYRQSFAHGLGKTPEFVILGHTQNSSTSSSYDGWWVYHSFAHGGSADHYLNLATTAGVTTGSFDHWSGSEIDATTFGLCKASFSDTKYTNESNREYTAYLWTSVPGYSAFGSYTGSGYDGSNTPSQNSPFIYTGFKPHLILTKRLDAASNWYMFDQERDDYNPVDNPLQANSNGVEPSSYNNQIDILSNGFKLRSSDAGANGSTATYLYAAWAKNPFGGSNISPATAH